MLAIVKKTQVDQIDPEADYLEGNVHMSETLREDLQELNTRVHQLETTVAVTNVKLAGMQKSVENLCNGLLKAVWIFGGSILVAAATFVVNGGLIN